MTGGALKFHCELMDESYREYGLADLPGSGVSKLQATHSGSFKARGCAGASPYLTPLEVPAALVLVLDLSQENMR